eukprot:CAMPEP_0115166000 /NCGR_PEP_ID=MMETSP0227-20121206/73892_1 /TAXON_ID=89957 /ORGANISM="Polarella glacialis, Strain CCMP 1383" /LENGTH=89 /DNA_ID=CAMNT_0002578509 /DNA_START=98 /DNA_END=367 /DNA_ORIENTATION=-
MKDQVKDLLADDEGADDSEEEELDEQEENERARKLEMAEKGGDADISAAYANLAAHAKVYTCFSEELSAGYAESHHSQTTCWLACWWYA